MKKIISYVLGFILAQAIFVSLGLFVLHQLSVGGI
jgi:hypothetical protein